MEELRAEVADQAQELEGLRAEVAELRRRLEAERMFLTDVSPHIFKSWLRDEINGKPHLPWCDVFVKNPSTPPYTSYAMYRARFRLLSPSREDQDDFIRWWKLMLLDGK